MSYIALDYVCAKCGARTGSLELRSSPAKSIGCPSLGCRGRARRTLSAVSFGTVYGAPVSRMKSDPRPGPATLDTRPLAEGMPLKEWRAKRSSMWRDRRHAQNRRDVG